MGLIRNIRHLAALVVVTLVAALCVALGPLRVGGASAATPCAHFTVTGAVRSGTSARPRWAVAVFLHNRPRPLAHGRADSKGRFAVAVCRSTAVKAYAKHRGGHVNLDVVAHAYNRRSAWLVRTVAPRLATRSVAVPARFVAAATDTPVASALAVAGTTIATGNDYTSSAYAHPSVMYLEAVPGITTTYTLDSTTMKSIAATIGTDGGGYGADGSIAINDENGFSLGGQVQLPKGQTRYAVNVRPEVHVTMTYTCYTSGDVAGAFGYEAGVSVSCTHALDAEWTGGVRHVRADYTPCSQGVAPVTPYNNRRTRYVAVQSGTTFVEKGGFKTPFVQADFSTTYGEGNGYTYTLNRAKELRRFCFSGNAATVAKSSVLYVTPHTSAAGVCPAVAEPAMRAC